MKLPVDSPFREMYRNGPPPWDIGRAQPAFVELANQGFIGGSVLDAGCGTGDLVLELAERGHEAWGFDLVPEAIQQAEAKAKERGLEAAFLVGDALEMESIGRRFDTVTDCGLFHIFSDEQRGLYEAQLKQVLNPGGRLHVLCFSDWEDPRWGGPRRVSQAELLDTFRSGWLVEDIVEARFLARPGFDIRGHAWLATFQLEKAGGKPAKLQAQTEPPKRRPRAQEVVAPAA